MRGIGIVRAGGIGLFGLVAVACGVPSADDARLRTPGSGVWITQGGTNMENFGVPPDVHVDNTPGDHAKGRDALFEKAVDVFRAEIAARTKR